MTRTLIALVVSGLLVSEFRLPHGIFPFDLGR
jgi:hypothetical protein